MISASQQRVSRALRSFAMVPAFGIAFLLNSARIVRWQGLFLFFVTGGMITMPDFAHPTGRADLVLGFWGSGDYSCDSSYNSVGYTGAVYDLTVTVLPAGERPAEVEYTGISDWTWPADLAIRVGQVSDLDEEIRPSASLTERLQLVYYVMRSQAVDDSLWRASGRSPQRPAPEYHFSFVIPPELAGSYLCFQAQWRHPEFGSLSAEQWACMKVTSPCSASAHDLVKRTHVKQAYQQGKFDFAVFLADSFVARGWRDRFGLAFAEMAAKRVGLYDEAIRFLDLSFTAHGVVDPWTPRDPQGRPTPDSQQDYERIRSQLVELKNQQQQR